MLTLLVLDDVWKLLYVLYPPNVSLVERMLPFEMLQSLMVTMDDETL